MKFYDLFKEKLQRAAIELDNPDSPSFNKEWRKFDPTYSGERLVITIDAEGEDHPTNPGQLGFYTDIIFNTDGELIAIKPWRRESAVSAASTGISQGLFVQVAITAEFFDLLHSNPIFFCSLRRASAIRREIVALLTPTISATCD